ncbi:Fungal specific transcription factor domain-containing protein isoform 1 [Cladophialophora immunda]|nr:Fungal specific transcription factor domain-containing protein isoform 1 [Cladophialophora immunda]
MASGGQSVAPGDMMQQLDGPQVQSSCARASPVDNEQAGSTGSATDPATREEDIHFRICEEMSRPRQIAVSPSPQSHNTDRHEVIELHEGVNPMTILGEALARQHPNRFVRVIVEDCSSKPCPRQYIAGFDYADVVYLETKGGLSLPPRHIRDELLRLYFAYIYPYAPILDRVKFMQDYRADRHSIFVLQSIFANVVPYAPEQLLKQAGYEDRITAQKQLYAKAALLYDMRYEKNQLYLLQGSIMLSSLSFSYAIDKDYRYWLTNAGRIATQMGLHRNYVSQNLGRRSKRLFRSIWWVLYNRDTLLTISGIDNLKRFDERYCDTAPLEESDWEEEGEVPPEFRNVLPPITRVQKAFMVEYSKLSIVSKQIFQPYRGRRVWTTELTERSLPGGVFIRDFKTPAKTPTPDEIEQLSNKIIAWRKQLPVEIIHAFQDEWTSDNVLILVLLAMGYRLEAVFARAAKDHYRTRGDLGSMQRMTQRQENAMFELSTMIQRASLNDVLHLCPLSL